MEKINADKQDKLEEQDIGKHQSPDDDNPCDHSNDANQLDSSDKTEETPHKETKDVQNKEIPGSDRDIILRNDDTKETKPKWNEKSTIVTILSAEGADEHASCKNEKNAVEVKTKKIPKVLSKLCLGPGEEDTQCETPKQDDVEECEYEVDTKEKKLTTKSNITKTFRTIIKNKISECSDLSSGEAEAIETKTENATKRPYIGTDIKNFSARTPRMLRRMFLRKGSSSMESTDDKEEKSSDTNDLIYRTALAPPADSDSEDEEEPVELRTKPQSFKHTLSEGFRNSFRLKRTLSEPAHKSKYQSHKKYRNITVFRSIFRSEARSESKKIQHAEGAVEGAVPVPSR